MKRVFIFFASLALLCVSCHQPTPDELLYDYGVTKRYIIDSAHAFLDGESGFPMGFRITNDKDQEMNVSGLSGKMDHLNYKDGYIYVVSGYTYETKNSDPMCKGRCMLHYLKVLEIHSVTKDETNNDDIRFPNWRDGLF